MSQVDLPTSFWGFAFEIATFLLNLTPTKAVEKTPYEIWTGRKPNMSTFAKLLLHFILKLFELFKGFGSVPH